MTSAPLVNPALHEGFWIEARYALSAADGRIHKSLLINREARGHIDSQMAQLNDAHFDLEILSGLFADIFPDYFDRSSFVAWLEQGLRAFDSLAGRFTAAVLREAEPGQLSRPRGSPRFRCTWSSPRADWRPLRHSA